MRTGRARFEFRIVPTAGRELTAFLGEIAACLDEQRPGVFWQAKDQLFQMAATGSYNGDSGRVLAQNLGLDYGEALECARTGQQVATDVTLANGLGVTGTPAVMIRIDGGQPTWIQAGGQQLNRGGVPYEILANVVDSNS